MIEAHQRGVVFSRSTAGDRRRPAGPEPWRATPGPLPHPRQ
ncbi:hypothetical protein [Klebsiella pneumoniae IS53]|nr:hypothetical protein [Klebsiella pneumoniae IS53]